MSFVLRVSAAAAALSVVTLVVPVAVTTPTWAADLGDVVVTASRVAQPVSEVIGSVTVITREEIQKRQASSLQELLRGEVGIDVTNTGGSGKISSLYLRGASPTQTLVLIDGVRLGSATAGTTSIEFIPVEQIERIEIVRGPRSSLYGSDAIGGVIQIFTRNNDGFTASAGAGTYRTQQYGAGFGMQGDTLRFSVNSSYQQTDGFNSCVGSFAGGCFTIEPDDDGDRNSSVTAQLGYAFGELADLELRTLYVQGFTEYDGSFVNETRFRNSAPSLKLRLTPSESLSLTLSGGITQDRSENFQDSAYMSRFNTEKRNAGVQGDWQLGKQQISLGVDYLDDRIDSDTAYVLDQRDNKGVYAQYLGKLGTHELSASVRRDDNEQFGSHNTGNVGWKWFAIGNALTVNAGWGSAFHVPTFNDLYYPFGYGNPNLKPERSDSYELGISGNADWLEWSLQNYLTDATDLIAYNNAFLPDNISKAKIFGTELYVNGKWQKLTAGLNYTYQNPRSRGAGSTYDHLLPRRARNSGRVEVGYDFGAAQITGRANVVGPRYDDLANTLPLAGYTTVDLLADVALGKGFALQVKLGNFFDRQYETVRYYNQEGRTVFVTLRYQPK